MLIIDVRTPSFITKIKDYQQARIQTTATFALANLEKFTVSEKSGKRCEIGETLDKIGKPGNFEEVNFFPVSAPGMLGIIEIKDKRAKLKFFKGLYPI